MRKFLLIGIYSDGQRWANEYEAETPEEAEEMVAESEFSEVTIAGVIELVSGKMEVVA